MHNSNCSCGGGGCCGVHMTAKILVIIGGLNWGLVGAGMLMGKAMDWNVVHMILGSMPTLEAIVYVFVGVGAVMKIFGCRCKKCMSCAVPSGEAGGMDKNM